MLSYKTKGKLVCIQKDFKGKLMVAGDLHGDLEAFEQIRKRFLQTKDSILVFLGDYADRGSYGLEVIEGVKDLMDKFGYRVIALKGNHEDYRDGIPRFSPCDLMLEVETKRRTRWADFFPRFEREFLLRLPLAVLVPRLALLVHGGISSKIRNLADLTTLTERVEEDILWSDPCKVKGEYPNPRGTGVLFGPDVSRSFAKRIGVRFLVRSHELRKAFEGPCVEHSGRVFTLSSTRVYGGKAFVLFFRPDPKLTQEELRGGMKDLFDQSHER